MSYPRTECHTFCVLVQSCTYVSVWMERTRKKERMEEGRMRKGRMREERMEGGMKDGGRDGGREKQKKGDLPLLVDKQARCDRDY